MITQHFETILDGDICWDICLHCMLRLSFYTCNCQAVVTSQTFQILQLCMLTCWLQSCMREIYFTKFLVLHFLVVCVVCPFCSCHNAFLPTHLFVLHVSHSHRQCPGKTHIVFYFVIDGDNGLFTFQPSVQRHDCSV